MIKNTFCFILKFVLVFTLGFALGIYFIKDSHENSVKRSLLAGEIFTPYLLKTERSNSYSKAQTPVTCPVGEYLGVVTFGQSNVTNTIVRQKLVKYIDDRTFMYDWATGQCHIYSEPVVGTDGLDGNMISDLVQTMRKAGYDKPLVFAPLGRSGSSIFSWMKGIHKKRLDYFTELAKENGLKFDVWFWQQGETEGEAEYYSTYKKIYWGDETGSVEQFYTRALSFLFDYIKEYNPDATLGVSLTSVCDNHGSRAVRAAQQSVIDSHGDVFFSSDTDLLDESYRRDNCHFNAEGAFATGQDYADILLNYVKSHP